MSPRRVSRHLGQAVDLGKFISRQGPSGRLHVGGDLIRPCRTCNHAGHTLLEQPGKREFQNRVPALGGKILQLAKNSPTIVAQEAFVERPTMTEAGSGGAASPGLYFPLNKPPASGKYGSNPSP